MLVLSIIMENHPIPQNVTGFQFKLIGDMTVKQFVYLTSGVLVGWLFVSLPIIVFIKYPIAAFFVFLGIGFAFIPLAGRPLDVMLHNFIKSLLTPTQYIYNKKGQANWVSSTSASGKNQTIVVKEPQKKEPVLEEHPVPNAPIPQSSPPRLITVEVGEEELEKEKKENEELRKKEEKLENELKEVKSKEESLDQQSPTTLDIHKKVISLEEELQEILSQKEELSQQIVELQKRLNVQKKPVFQPTTPTSDGAQTAQTLNAKIIPAKIMPKDVARTIGLPTASESPNVIVGVIRDPRGNPLPNILVEIKDKSGNPVRAFKTTLMGQFASATALANGTYTMEMDDPKGQNRFDIVEIIAKGEIIPPVEVRSVDTREELRKSLFGPTTT